MMGRAHRFDLRGVSASAYGDLSASYQRKVPIRHIMTFVICTRVHTGNFLVGHSSRRAGENQRDVPHRWAKAKSVAFGDGGTPVGVRFLIFLRIPPHYTQA